MIALILSLTAFAAPSEDCPWPTEFDAVASGMTWVSIDGDRHRVAGRANWSRLSRDLRECDMDHAVFVLERWRSQRRATNITGVLGLVLSPWIWIATPFTAMAAGRWRAELEDELYAWDGIDGERRPATPVDVVEKATEAAVEAVEAP